MKPIIQLHNLPNGGPTGAPLRGWRECPLWVSSQELEEEGGIHYGSGGCNVQMARCSQRDLSHPATIPAFIHGPPRSSAGPGLVVTQGWSSGEEEEGVVNLEMFP